MPIYNFYDKKKRKAFTDMMSIAEKEEFLRTNPHIEQRLSVPHIGDATRLGIKKAPADFQKYVLGRIKEQHPLGNVERKAGTIRREI